MLHAELPGFIAIVNDHGISSENEQFDHGVGLVETNIMRLNVHKYEVVLWPRIEPSDFNRICKMLQVLIVM